MLSIADTAIIGNVTTHATESLAAVGIVGSFISMLIWVFGQIRSAISSIISQYLGANKLNEIKTLPAQAILIIVIGSIIIVLLSYPFAETIFKFYNATNLVLSYCVIYFKIRIIGFPFSLFVFAVFGVFRGLQNTFYPMVIAITGASLNIVLDYLFVYGFADIIPAMHIQGAALASVIAQVVMAILAFTLLLTKTSISLNVRFPFHSEMKTVLSMIGNLFIRTIALNVALYMATSYATSYGNTQIAAYTIGVNIWLLGAFMIDGYSSAGNILSGKLYGAKDYKNLLLLGNQLIKYGIVVGCIMTVIGGVFYNSIGRLFIKEKEVLEQFYNVFYIVLLTQPINAISFIFDGMFKGMGKMKYLRNLLLLSTGLVFVPSLLFFDYLELELTAIWITFTLWILARGFPLVYAFRKKFVPLANG